MSAAPPAQLFTVHLWLEDLGHGITEWRGQVRHVPSRATRYFRDWATLITFLEAWGQWRPGDWPGSLDVREGQSEDL